MSGSVLVRGVWLVVGAVVVVAGLMPSQTSGAAAATASNGKLVTTVYDESYSPDVWAMDPDGSNPMNLTAGWVHANGTPSSESDPAWSPDGRYIVLSSTRGTSGISGNTQSAIWVVNADGSGARQVTFPGTGTYDQDRSPAWSPDGEWIVFNHQVSVGAFASEAQLYKVRENGSELTQLTSYTEDGTSLEARWSPDGSEIVFVAYPTNLDDQGLAVIKPDGSGLRLIGPAGADEPRWSTVNGDRIAYTDCKAGCSVADIRIVNRDGSGDSLLRADAQGPVWSPDGSTMLFSVFDRIEVNAIYRLYSVATAGGTPVEITIPFDQTKHSVSTDWDWQPLPQEAGSPVVGLVDPGQGLWRLFDDAGALTTQFFYGNPGDFPIVGDWDCDGVETPGMYRQSDGYVYLRNSNTQGAADVKFFFGDPGDVPIAGDFNNDGCDTVSIYRPSSQTFYIINELGENDGGLGAADFSYVFGDPGDKPFVGDFDGDGIETVGLHRESTGLVYFRNSHTQGNADAQFIFGDPDDRLIAGDWNGDGKYSPALFRPSNTTIFFRYTNTQGNADNQFIPNPNGSTWLPVAGNFK